MKMRSVQLLHRRSALLLAAAVMVLAGCAAPPETLWQRRGADIGTLREVELVIDAGLMLQNHDRAALEAYYQHVGAEVRRLQQERGVSVASTVVFASVPLDPSRAGHVVLLQPLNAVVTRTGTDPRGAVTEIQWRMAIFKRGAPVAGSGMQLVQETRFKAAQGIARVPLEPVWKQYASHLAVYIDQQLRGAGA
ncbi:MAG TPA: hypothetical protein VF522_09305 [Ramlibacter sp.]|uniref:hypothetical protein n=1 Tax=Ramlibacter sp. TaxID=1917967 RepID=UPI002ED515F7